MMESISGAGLIHLDMVVTMEIKTFIASRFCIMRTVSTNEKIAALLLSNLVCNLVLKSKQLR